MKRSILFQLIFIIFISIAFPQTKRFYVKPEKTDKHYSSEESRHYIVRNKNTHLNKLVLFIGGTSSRPENYAVFCRYAASLGFDVISLSYPNGVAAMSVSGSLDSLAFNKYRQEICFGTPVSNYVEVDSLNSINIRFLKLIQYLSTKYPEQSWKQYLLNPNSPDWSKIIIAGHSQGSGHASFIAKRFDVERVLMFSGPNDFSTYYNRPANWFRKSGVTSLFRHFALLHLHDEVVSFSKQYENLKALGLTLNSDSLLVDNINPPFHNSHILYTDVPALLKHNSPIGRNPVMKDVWKFMLTSRLVH